MRFKGWSFISKRIEIVYLQQPLSSRKIFHAKHDNFRFSILLTNSTTRFHRLNVRIMWRLS